MWVLQPQLSLCVAQPTKEKVELTTLGTTKIEIPHLTRFTLILLLRIQRYMWRNHVTTWA